MQKKSRIIAQIILLLLPLYSVAQYDHIPVFSDLDGDELIVAVVENYKPGVVLTYGQARDTMFSQIDAVGDSLECAYTGMKLYLTPGEDPTQTVYLDGASNGINTEHSYPQSKGASTGNPRSDMHHLYPTRVKTNNDRGSKIYVESNDQQTQIWYRKMTEQNNIPGNNIDEWSELGGEGFEPRESVKGNIARSLMYFYTMYRFQADAADPLFFEMQKETLCDWHYLDPVDQVEWMRSQKIALWQEGKANPFVLDCSLAARIYCNEVSDECMLVDIEDQELLNLRIYPNPTTGILYVEGVSSRYVTISDVNGNLVSLPINEGRIDVSNLSSGIYFLSFTESGKLYSRTFILM